MNFVVVSIKESVSNPKFNIARLCNVKDCYIGNVAFDGVVYATYIPKTGAKWYNKPVLKEDGSFGINSFHNSI